jgi:hypothetical protein
MDALVPLLIGLLWGLALAGLFKVWTVETILEAWITEKRGEERDEQH